MSISITWSPYFQSEVKRRGRARQLAGQVELLEDSGREVLLRVKVAGEDGEPPEEVVIHRSGRAAEAECTCDTYGEGQFCEHIWSALMEAQYSEHPQAAAAGEALAGLRVRAPKARKRDHAQQPARQAEPEWMGRLTLLRPGPGDRAPSDAGVFPMQRQVCYAVLPASSTRHNGLVVELRQRVAIATGWSRPKPLRLATESVESLDDPEDRVLCAMLIGATWVHDQMTSDMLRVERSHATYRVARGAQRALLKRMIATGRCFVELHEDMGLGEPKALTWDGDDPWSLWVAGRLNDGGLRVTAEIRRGGKSLDIASPRMVLGGSDGVVIYDGGAAPFDDHDAFRWVAQFRDGFAGETGESRPMEIDEADIGRFVDRLYMLPQLPELDLPDGIGRAQRMIAPSPHLELFSPGSIEAGELSPGSSKHQLVGRVWFGYDDQHISAGQRGRFVPVMPRENEGEGDAIGDDADEPRQGEGDASRHPLNGVDVAVVDQTLIRRDLKRENDALALLSSLGLRHLANSAADAVVVGVRQVSAVAAVLLTRGWTVLADRKLLHAPGPPNLSITSGIDWFELRGTLSYQRGDGREQEVTLPQVLAAARSGCHMITLDDGSQGLLPEQWLAEHGLLTAIGRVRDDHLIFRRSQAAVLDALLEEKELSTIDECFAEARTRLRAFAGVKALDADESFVGSLRGYQREGLGWMAFLRWFGMGGILADDMGLGKTIQVLALLQARVHGVEAHCRPDDAGSERMPSLIVAPRSVVFNWIDEATRFTPDLRVLAYTGTGRDQLREAFTDHDVIVMSYGLLRRDVEMLMDHRFDYVVLDEAQAIKNPQSQGAKAARLLNGRYRLALTGTPIENHLGDLWSIFEYLNPGMLGSSSRFNEVVRNSTAKPMPGEEDDEPGEDQSIKQIATALRPFILRRSKGQVLKDLPQKTEQTILCEMEPAQRKIYDDLRAYYRGTLMKQLDGEGVGGTGESGTPGEPGPRTARLASGGGGGGGIGSSAFMVLEALLRLRQAACHPGLIDPGKADEPSAKLEALEQMLADVMEEGGKALVFSQFTSMLALVRRRLDAQGIRYAYLDGQTRNRKEVVDQFQNDPTVQVFLISLKAGGVGLNLTAAEYVFILDPWWNPAVEAQAIDRTHRIGQTRPVFAYRMICEDTVEQRIIDLQGRKRDLADAIVGGEQNLLRNLSREDLERLLS